MLSKFLDGVGGELAKGWVRWLLAPAAVFWVVGALAWLASHPTAPVDHWVASKTTGQVTAVFLAILAAVVVVGIVLDQLTAPVTRLLEGYWPSWADRVNARMTARQVRRQRDERSEWSRVEKRLEEARLGAGATPEDVARRAGDERRAIALDRRNHRRPVDEVYAMPTTLGNILRSAETLPTEYYGLDAVTVWPALWLVLPDATKAEIEAAQRALDASVAVAEASLLSCVWVIWAWWAAPLAIALTILTYRLFVLSRAGTLADLLEAAVAVHRWNLYDALGWPRPVEADLEREQGELITRYLWRGYAPKGFRFTHDGNAHDPG